MKNLLAWILGSLPLLLPSVVRAQVEMEPEPPEPAPVPAMMEPPAPTPWLSDGPSVLVLRDGDRAWRERRGRVKLGLTLGGVAVGALGVGVMAAALADTKRCQDLVGFCKLGDTLIAMLGGFVAAGGASMVIVGSALQSERSGIPYEPRVQLGIGPGSAHLSAAF